MRVYTSVERTFKKRKDGFYQEIFNHFIHMTNHLGVETTKLDRQVIGKVYKEETEHRSVSGEATYTFEDDGLTRRLIAI